MNIDDVNEMIKAPKWIIEGSTQLDNLGISDNMPFQRRFDLVDSEHNSKFLFQIKQSDKNMMKLSLHHQNSSIPFPLTRIDYSGPHKNPEVITDDLPEEFHNYAGKVFTKSENHIHYHVDGYNPLAWAIPLSETDFPVKEIDLETEHDSKIVKAILAFCDYINLQTKISFQLAAAL